MGLYKRRFYNANIRKNYLKGRHVRVSSIKRTLARLVMTGLGGGEGVQ